MFNAFTALIFSILFGFTLLHSSPGNAGQVDYCKENDPRFPKASVKGCLIANQIRVSFGLPELVLDAEMTAAAMDHAVYMAKTKYFSHYSETGLTPFERMAKHGVIYHKDAAENINEGYKTTERAFYLGWLKSPPHRKELLNPIFHRQGYAEVNGYRVQLFAD